MSKEIEALYASYNHVEEYLKRKTQESKNFEKLFESTNGAYSALKEQFYTIIFQKQIWKLGQRKRSLQECGWRKVELTPWTLDLIYNFLNRPKLLDEKSHLLELLEDQNRILINKKVQVDQILSEKENYVNLIKFHYPLNLSEANRSGIDNVKCFQWPTRPIKTPRLR